MNALIFLGTVAAIYLPVLWSPGPNFVVVSRSAISLSRSHGVFTAFGISSGTVIWVTLASLSTKMLLENFAATRGWIQAMGGTYLAYMGLKILSKARHPIRVNAEGDERGTVLQSYLRGLVTSLTNPQSLIFFTSIFGALFTPAVASWLRWAGVLVIISISVVSYSAQAVFFSNQRMQKAYTKAKSKFDCVAGFALVAIGMKLVVRT
jgi:threonine efflux protein